MQTGYKPLILRLTGLVAALHVCHWAADTRTNEHRALGDLYDTLNGLADSFAEMALGRMGSRDFPPASIQSLVAPYADLIAEALSLVDEIISAAMDDGAQDIINVCADMQKSLNDARYFLVLPVV
jgi:hypothetical protein